MPVPTYHLRRVNPKSHHPEELILLGEVTKFGRNADNVDVVLTSAVYSNMISRDHAIITGRTNPNGQIIGYRIRDNSLNGTYINDRRVKDEVILSDNAVIKFGHMNGAAIKAGVEAPQANAEFSFVFEKWDPRRRYIGWEGTERRRTVVCTGDGKPISETGEDHRIKRKPVVKVEPVSSTTTSTPSPFPTPQTQSPLPQAQSHFPPVVSGAEQMQQQILLLHQQQKLMNPFTHLAHPFIQQQLAGFQMRANGQFPTMPMAPQHGQMNPVMRLDDPSPSVIPIRSPPVECDSSVPSPPKLNGSETRTNHADSSSQQSPRGRVKDEDEDSFSVPDSPPRAPRPHDIPGRSVTNSPAPPSPKPVEKPVETPKEEKKKVATPKKKPVNTGKVPKSGGGGEKRSNKEVDRLLTDLTEGSFMMQARRRLSEGGGSERRKMLDKGKKSAKKAAPKNKLHQQLSSASSDEDSDDDERVSVRPSTASRPSMVGKKASSTPKTAMKRNGGGMVMGRKQDASDDSDPYEESDEDSEAEKKNAKKKVVEKKTPVAKTPKKATPAKSKAKPPKKSGKRKKKGSDESSGSDSDVGKVEDEEEEFVDTETTTCASILCVPPKGETVHWVECDGCNKWYHNSCVLGKNLEYEGQSFLCGCTETPEKKKKKK